MILRVYRTHTIISSSLNWCLGTFCLFIILYSYHKCTIYIYHRKFKIHRPLRRKLLRILRILFVHAFQSSVVMLSVCSKEHFFFWNPPPPSSLILTEKKVFVMSNSSFPSLTLKADGMCNAFAKSNVLIFTK